MPRRQSPTSRTAGEVIQRSFRSQLLQRDWTYSLYLPPGGAVSGRSYPVIYLLHGAAGTATDFVEQGRLNETADRLIRTRAIPPTVIVTPEGYESWYVDNGDLPMQTAFFAEFLPHIEAALPVSSARLHRFVAGVSMGGFGALRFALLQPELFAAVALISPAVYAEGPPEGSGARQGSSFARSGADGALSFDPALWARANYPALLTDYLAQPHALRFLVTAGDRDEFGIEAEARRLYRLLRSREQDARLCLGPGGHNWDTWTPELETALRFLLEPLAEPAV